MVHSQPEVPTVFRLTLIRHGDAGSRSRFSGPDEERPLTVLGHRQAAELARQLVAPFVAVVSSPAVRCVATVEPIAALRGLSVETDVALRESSTASRCLAALIGRAESAGGDVVGSTHGPIFEEILATLDPAIGAPRRTSIPKAGRIELVVDRGAIVSVATFPSPVIVFPGEGGGA
jgi:8-oxo-dGTP diphosphatase